MKSIRYYYFLLSLLLIVGCKSASVAVIPNTEVSNFEKLAAIENIVSIEKRAIVSHFDENYELWFEQPIDYNDSTKGTFKQRVFLGFENPKQPVIVELSGYGIGSEKAGELATHYNANQLSIEHRYFNNSRPEDIDWNTLTVENAAKDQATIITAIRNALYPNSKFISTGISKGCQTVMAHRLYFPENVDACVCYVGPLNFAREDERIFEFLKNVGTAKERAKIRSFQDLCFENKAALLEILKTKAKEKAMTWEFGIEKALEYSILEYPFAYWQWGTDANEIPKASASPEVIYKHLFDVVGYSFFEESSVENLQPYFWAALTQQGIYGYETMPFEKYLHTDKIYTFDWAFPEGITKTYDLKPMQRIKSFLDLKAEKMLFIYGEYDAWSATAVELTENASKRELYKFVKPKGNHKTRIKSFDAKEQKEIYSIIDSWLK
ncbi:PS-10 peptidase S37 [Aequorivita sublithincola DSM 14238]|uniref:PS-10 peptidase S37 n=1 Tax=Aequorivita sublithincola (strain DSM 14238 / LMG 21431 / ACAM 643 / 9-3) TaxID=746697 RepID=I3YYR3_AEQSU|nr:S28 family serine protease [Aequorivita sublithincola]AFL82131.1 PS-10 peptidase S37 [Aequorivita sublithincola DSM 14238]